MKTHYYLSLSNVLFEVKHYTIINIQYTYYTIVLIISLKTGKNDRL